MPGSYMPLGNTLSRAPPLTLRLVRSVSANELDHNNHEMATASVMLMASSAALRFPGLVPFREQTPICFPKAKSKAANCRASPARSKQWNANNNRVTLDHDSVFNHAQGATRFAWTTTLVGLWYSLLKALFQTLRVVPCHPSHIPSI